MSSNKRAIRDPSSIRGSFVPPRRQPSLESEVVEKLIHLEVPQVLGVFRLRGAKEFISEEDQIVNEVVDYLLGITVG